MLSSRSRLCGLCTTSLLLFCSLASAQTEAPRQAVLWYRSGEGCPDGASFLALIGDRAGQVRLAEAGDRVDFVVNLALGPEGATGRLERETARGTVAIREVKDASCDQVAQVVALNLSLALDPNVPPEAASAGEVLPETPPEGSTAEDPDPTIQPAPPEESPSSDKAGGAEQGAKTPPAREERSSQPEEQTVETLDMTWRLGLLGGVQSGLSTGLMGRGVFFLEAQGFVSSLPTLTLRGAAVGAFGSSDTKIGEVPQALWAGQVQLCPVAWGSSFAFAPCVSAELGQLRAKGPLSDSALWASVGAHAKGRWLLSRLVSVEVEIGADVPLRKYQVRAGSDDLYATAPLGVSALVGAAITF